MKKILLLVVILSKISFGQAQQVAVNPNLKAMVDTERAFAKMAKDQNTRDAFLYYLTDDVITSGDKGPIAGKKEIEKQKAGNAWLYWDVAFSDIAASGDFGYNTGPWEFRKTKDINEKPIAFGEFNSIWKKQADGSWKNALDVGVSHEAGPLVESIKLTTSARPLTSGKKKSLKPSEKNKLIEVEKQFLSLNAKDRKSAYEKFLSNESRIIHARQFPIITTEAKQKFISEPELVSNIHLISGDIATSNDLGYIYGKADVQVTVKDKTENQVATYFRVWKKEEGKNWRIVLDVLSY